MDTWYIVLLLFFTLVTAILAMKTNMLRDDLNDKEQFLTIATVTRKLKPKAPFSLAKTQLAFWTIIIISSFLYLYFSADDAGSVPDLTYVSLILLGISAGTTTVGKIIDDSQKNIQRHQNHPSRGLLIDLLSDEKGVSVHRLQNVIWNVIVAIIYIRYVFIKEAFPNDTVISDTLLMLMGISTGAYLGIKVTENSGNNPTGAGFNPPVLTEEDIIDSYSHTPPLPHAGAGNKPAPQDGAISQY